jgi:hypothetical protein
VCFNGQITTVIPTYRRPRLLRRAIQSVLNQTYPHFELHVYDNDSGDETRDVVAGFARRDSRVKYYCHPKNIGPIPNFAVAVAEVTTPFFNILSDDDLLAHCFFQVGIEAFSHYPEAMLFSGATVKADPSGNLLDVPIERFRAGLYSPPEGFFALLNNGHTDWTGIIFRSETLSAVGGLDVRTGTAVDIDFEWRIAAQCAIAVSKKPVAVFFVHPDQVSSAATDSECIQTLWSSWNVMLNNVRTISALTKDDSRRATELILQRIRRSLLFHGCDAAARGSIDAAKLAASILAHELGSPWSAFGARAFNAAATGIPTRLTEGFAKMMRYLNQMRSRRRMSWAARGSYQAFVRALLEGCDSAEQENIDAPA